ncbi:MAG: hypothetical protein IKE21_06120 [Erysipelotrichaceae bacterium]|nr:hypothetical protein [Erysipelotrichaceae bacterium]
MKRRISILLILALSACAAQAPSSVSGPIQTELPEEPVAETPEEAGKMIRLEGTIYRETEEFGDIPRCGNLDFYLESCEGEFPEEGDYANFPLFSMHRDGDDPFGKGGQRSFWPNRIEIPTEEGWRVFAADEGEGPLDIAVGKLNDHTLEITLANPTAETVSYAYTGWQGRSLFFLIRDARGSLAIADVTTDGALKGELPSGESTVLTVEVPEREELQREGAFLRIQLCTGESEKNYQFIELPWAEFAEMPFD